MIWVLASKGEEATGSMGDDTPMAVLSKKQRSLYDYFRQKFAQVTNADRSAAGETCDVAGHLYRPRAEPV